MFMFSYQETKRQNNYTPHRLRRIFVASLLLMGGILLLSLIPALAQARSLHGEYASSEPAADAMLVQAPRTITMHFMENIDPGSSGSMPAKTATQRTSTPEENNTTVGFKVVPLWVLTLMSAIAGAIICGSILSAIWERRLARLQERSHELEQVAKD